MSDAFEKMDRMYRFQRYFYDATRKYYLLGRDKLIREMKIEPNANTLEIGCGTGRNLIILAEKHPRANFFGLDASAAMLETAGKKIESKKLRNIRLATALADDFSFDKTFGLEKPFDRIFFSYSISMIPAWRESIADALANLAAGEKLFIVDFSDQRDLPAWFRRILQLWLKQFHVKYPAELLPHLRDLERGGAGKLKIKSLYRNYSFIAEFQKANF